MLTLDLARLEQERGPVHVYEEVPPDAPLFENTDLQLGSPLTVDVTVSVLPSGEIVVRGEFSATLSRECRRCLDPMEVPVEEEVDLLYVPKDELAPEEEKEEQEAGIRRFDLTSGKLELGEAIREEAILAAPLYVECDPDCKGLCPECGTNLNEEDCDCTLEELDPRWDALRGIHTE